MAVAEAIQTDEVRRVDPDAFYTPDEFLTLEGNEGYELVDGRPVERDTMAADSQYVALKIAAQLDRYEEEHGGFAFGDGTPFRAFGELGLNVYKPDAAYVGEGRLDAVPSGDIEMAPDLAVEVTSPCDTVGGLEDKVTDYLEHGTRVVWLISPIRRGVREVRQEGERYFGQSDELTCEDVLPGFSVPVARLFRRIESGAA